MKEIELSIKHPDIASDIDNRVETFLKAAASLHTQQRDKYTIIAKAIEGDHINWEHIAMRGTIAALTIFLVQIFFHIFKYNQTQESLLSSKAEVLELYKEDEPKRKDLRAYFLSKIDSNPAFSKSPKAPGTNFNIPTGGGKTGG